MIYFELVQCVRTESFSMAALFGGVCGVWAAKGSFTISPFFTVCGEGLAVSAATCFISTSLQVPLPPPEIQPHWSWP